MEELTHSWSEERNSNILECNKCLAEKFPPISWLPEMQKYRKFGSSFWEDEEPECNLPDLGNAS